MINNWNGQYAKEFVELFETYGINRSRFEDKFSRKHKQLFGKPYTQAYKTAKVAYQRHATIKRFLNYKQKNLCDLTDDFKYFGVWLMRREGIKNVRTSMGYTGMLDKNNEPLSEYEGSDVESIEILNPKQSNDSSFHISKKRKLNSRYNKQYITKFDDETEDDSDIITMNNNNNEDIIDKLNVRNLVKSKRKSKEIKGVNGVKDAIKQLSNISPALGDLITESIKKGLINVDGKGKKKKNNNLMIETLVKLQEQTKRNKQEMTLDDIKDAMEIFMKLLRPPSMELINVLIGCGFNKNNIFHLWLSNNEDETFKNISPDILINNIGILYKKNKMDELIDMWLLVRAITNDDTSSVLHYLNEHFKNIKGWNNLTTKETFVNDIEDDMNIVENNDLPPNINIEKENEEIPYDKREMDE